MTILHIDSAITGDASVSRELSAAIMAKLTEKTTDASVVYRNLTADPLPHLTTDAPQAGIVDEYLAADTVVIGAPLYNFGIPSQFKAWIDRILVPGKTFIYTANGMAVSPDHRTAALADPHVHIAAL